MRFLWSWGLNAEANSYPRNCSTCMFKDLHIFQDKMLQCESNRFLYSQIPGTPGIFSSGHGYSWDSSDSRFCMCCKTAISIFALVDFGPQELLKPVLYRTASATIRGILSVLTDFGLRMWELWWFTL